MQNQHQSSNGENYEQPTRQYLAVDCMPTEISGEQQQIEQLLDSGFHWEEAGMLIELREHLYKNSEIRERVAQDSRMLFVRWLYEHGEISEDSSSHKQKGHRKI